MCLANLRREMVGPHYKMSELEGAHIVFPGFFFGSRHFCLSYFSFFDLKN